MKRHTRWVLVTVVTVGTVAYLMYTGVRQTAVYYITVEEFLQRRAHLVGQGVRVAGRVTPGSVQRRTTPRGEEVSFTLGDFKSDGGAEPTLRVFYSGIIPDMFRDEGGTDVIVEGRYDGTVLQAQSLLTSCPSKYEPVLPEAGTQAGGS